MAFRATCVSETNGAAANGKSYLTVNQLSTQLANAVFFLMFFCFVFRRKPRPQHQFCGNPGMRLITVFKGPLMMNRRMKYWLLQSISLSSELPRGCNFRIKGFGDDRSAIYERRLKSMFPVISTTRNIDYFFRNLYIVLNANGWIGVAQRSVGW